ncbi:Ran-specific GTPase-activating protein 30 [Saxophila tyrrhenica]|uniref:Ran-specific GTPase-activating protein 30 n=1 Tax=Saxophila tyrrhenica TaxID=1690608 RepID=A0AAV9P5E4_9PEZI|nr:Ran-specific GTPase-activating protein 30 [Saxophila tyrrhenica]
MDVLLGRVTSQAMNYAIRSGVTITTTYAIKQCARLLKETPRSQARDELRQLQLRLESKIRIISPAIDMIELISARGNTSLESAVSLTKAIRYEIQCLGTRLSDAANDERSIKKQSSQAKVRQDAEAQLQRIIRTIKALLTKIDDAIPLINLAITTSGVNLSTKLSGAISPSRLLQASTFLTAADRARRVKVGPTYTLSLYMLFAGHTGREEGEREMTWKEVVHKAKVKLVRVPLDALYDLPGGGASAVNGGLVADEGTIPGEGKAGEFAYQIVIIEDLDDDRVHTFDDGEVLPGPFEDVANAGIRDIVPVHEISKVFYADTGKILNIRGDGDTNNPVLLLRRDVHAEPPRRMMHRSQMGQDAYFDDSVIGETEVNGAQSEVDAQIHRESAPNTPSKESPARINGEKLHTAWRLPPDLDPEWLAFEVYTEEPDSEEDPEELSSRPTSSREDSPATTLAGALSKLNFRASTPTSSPAINGAHLPTTSPARPAPIIKTSLSLLEMLLKLTALQQFRQESHLAIEDELLNFFLEDSSSAGAGPDKDYRQRLRHDAVKRVGFDPYDESPIKRRGETYLEHARGRASPRPEFDAGAFTGQGYGEWREDMHEPMSSPPGMVRSSIEEGGGMPSSPSPMPSAPVSGSGRNGSRGGTPAQTRSGAGRTASQMSLLATPPSTAGSRQHFLRAQSEPKVRSPLGTSAEVNKGTSGSGGKEP